MKNDKERKAYIEDANNWHLANQIGTLVRVERLEYKGEFWARIQVREEMNVYNWENHKAYKKIEWHTLRMYKTGCDAEDNLYFAETQSTTQILNAMKAADKVNE